MRPKIYFLSKTHYSNSDDRFVNQLSNHGIMISNQLPQISPLFCDDNQANPMNTDYLVHSCKKFGNLCMYATFDNEVHSILSFTIKQTHVEVDAFCVNQITTADELNRKWYNIHGLSGATLLNYLFVILREIGLYLVKLDSMPSDRTVKFYRKHKFNEYAPVNRDGLIPMQRRLTPPNLSNQSSNQSSQQSSQQSTQSTPSTLQWSLADLDADNIRSINPPSKTHSTWNIRLRRPIDRPKKFNEFTEVGYVSHPTRQVRIPEEQQRVASRSNVRRTKRTQSRHYNTIARSIKTKRNTKWQSVTSRKQKMSKLKSKRQSKKSKRTAII